MRSAAALAPLLLAACLCGCTNVTNDAREKEAEDFAPEPSRSRWSFELPGEGTANGNGYIGPFCCTGETAIVASDDGRDLGYGYFFGWHGQAYNQGGSGFVPDLSIPVAGLRDLDPDADAMELEKGEIAFTAAELFAGLTRSTQAGALDFTVTIEHVEVEEWAMGPMMRMNLAVRLDVDPHE